MKLRARDNPDSISRSLKTELSPAWARWVEPRRSFPLLSLVFGIGLAFLTAPFQTSAEQEHFYRAYQVSEGHFLPLCQDQHGGADLPASLEAVGERFDLAKRHEVLSRSRPKLRLSDVKVSWAEIDDALHVPLNPRDRKFTRSIASIYSPACYIPQATSIWLGRQLGLGPLALMYVGRIGNLLFWIALGTLVLRITPTCRRPLLLLMLMPMTLFEAVSLSCDPTTNAMALLLIAMVLRYANVNGPAGEAPSEIHPAPARIGPAACIAFIAVSMMLAVSKFVYLPLLALVFLIPPARLGGPRRYFMAVGILGLLSLAAVMAWTLPTVRMNLVVMDKPGVSPSGQVQFLRAHPSHLWTVMMGTISEKSWGIIHSFVGYLGRLDARMNRAFTNGYLIVMFAACWLQEKRLSFPRRWLAPIILIPVAMSVLAMTLLSYIYVNPVGKDLADGVQGRYLIPLAPAIIVLLWGLAPRGAREFARGKSVALDVVAAGVVLCSCVYTVVVIWVRYYGRA